jgi:hypothetical protein
VYNSDTCTRASSSQSISPRGSRQVLLAERERSRPNLSPLSPSPNFMCECVIRSWGGLSRRAAKWMGTVEGEAELSSPEFCDADDSLALSVEDDADEFSVNDLMEEKGDHKGGGQPLPRAPPALDAGLAVEESSGVFDGLGESCHANGSPNSSNGDEASTSDPPEPAASDRFGFFLSSDRASAQQGTVMMAKDKEREEKWRKMKDHWEFTQSKRQSKLKRRVRKGLPNSMRSEMWPLLCGSKALMDENVGLYAKLLESDLPVDGPIEEDLPRTMYDHSSFCPRSPTRGKDILRRVLLAYGRYDRDVQYCQVH